MFTGGLKAADGGSRNTTGAPPGDVVLPSSGEPTQQSTESLAAREIPTQVRRFDPAPRTIERARHRVPSVTGSDAQRSRTGWVRRYRQLLVTIDLLAAVVGSGLAVLIRFVLLPAEPSATATYALLGWAMPVGWVAFVALNRAYGRRLIGVGSAEFDRVFRAWLQFTAVLVLILFAAKADVARGFVFVALPAMLMADLAGRYAARRLLHRRRRNADRSMSSVLLIGDVTSIIDFTTLLRRERYAGLRVVGACLPDLVNVDDAARAELERHDVPLLGVSDEVVTAMRACDADTVAVLSSASIGPQKLRWISWQLEKTETDLVVSPGLTEVAGPRLHIQPVAGLPLLHVEEPRFDGFRRVCKSGFDRAAAGSALLFLSPLFMGLWLAVRLTSAGPAFYRQTRIGVGGTPFTMVKFRSMYVDADQRLTDLQDGNHNADGLLFKMTDDPRVTKVGKYLRRYSLDELPQLFNVLLGHMSLVGPRPPLPTEVAQYRDHVHRRLLVKPGLTGLWQISGRSDLAWEEAVRLDLRYVENWSFALDLMILWKTVFAVVRGAGAY